MTDTIPAFSTTEAGNNQAASLFPEQLPPNQTTDNLRRLQAAIRQQWNQAQWFNLGDLDRSASYSFISGTQFRVQGAVVATEYHIGRRVRAKGSLTGTITGTISAVSQSGGNTDATVIWDSGALSNENFVIELSIISAIASSMPSTFNVGATFNGDSSVVGDLAVSEDLTVGGDLSGGSATFTDVSFTNGPFNIISAERRNNTGSPIVVPANTKQIILEIWGASGGGASEGATVAGGSGGNFTVSSDPAGREINVPGGVGGGTGGSDGESGQDLATSTGVSSSGVFKALLDVVNGGPAGGPGAGRGPVGSPGHFVKAIIDATESDITQFLLTGGERGTGGNEGGDPDGGNGSRAVIIATFYG